MQYTKYKFSVIKKKKIAFKKEKSSMQEKIYCARNANVLYIKENVL